MLSLIVEMSTRLLILCSLKASYTKDVVVESLKSLPVAFLLPEDLRNMFCQWRSKISYVNCLKNPTSSVWNRFQHLLVKRGS